jgi:hypothetical protein
MHPTHDNRSTHMYTHTHTHIHIYIHTIPSGCAENHHKARQIEEEEIEEVEPVYHTHTPHTDAMIQMRKHRHSAGTTTTRSAIQCIDGRMCACHISLHTYKQTCIHAHFAPVHVGW